MSDNNAKTGFHAGNSSICNGTCRHDSQSDGSVCRTYRSSSIVSDTNAGGTAECANNTGNLST